MRVSKWRTAELVDQYKEDQDTVLLRGGRRYRLRPENELALAVEGTNGDELSSAPLGQLRTKGEKLILPDGREVHPDQLESVRLVVHGEPLTRLDPYGDRPAGARGMLGLQFGGTSFFQLLVRARVVDQLHVEAGLMTYMGFAYDGSAGLLYELPVVGNLSVYSGAGAGFAASIFGTYAGYWHGRLGLGYRFRTENLWLGVDGGAWYGVMNPDGIGGKRERLLWPMGGFAFLYEL